MTAKTLIQRLLTATAWTGIALLSLMTIVPAAERPTTGLPHGFEHVAAFGMVGIFCGLAFRLKPLPLYGYAFLFSAALELVQIPLPSRHARLEDFLFDTIGAWLGLALGRSIDNLATSAK